MKKFITVIILNLIVIICHQIFAKADPSLVDIDQPLPYTSNE